MTGLRQTNFPKYIKNDFLGIWQVQKHKKPWPRLKIDGCNIKQGQSVKFLGVIIDPKLHWHDHIDHVKNKINTSLYMLRKVKNLLSKNHLKTLYNCFVFPFIDYGIALWGNAHST